MNKSSDDSGELLTQLPAAIRVLITELLYRCREVWIIGSQVNGTDKPPKEWEFLAFADLALLLELQSRPPVPALNLMVVYNGDDFESPWITYPEAG
jgi:hypothetical protein